MHTYIYIFCLIVQEYARKMQNMQLMQTVGIPKSACHHLVLLFSHVLIHSVVIYLLEQQVVFAAESKLQKVTELFLYKLYYSI